MTILLVTLNAKYSHTALGIRYLWANMGDLASLTRILEFDLQSRPIDVVEKILLHQPAIVGLSVYIWNATPMAEILSLLKAIEPALPVILGGPEVSYEWEAQKWIHQADHIVSGEGEELFPKLCKEILAGHKPPKWIKAPPVSLQNLELPYEHYTEEDIAHRMIYVESSRGCPFQCEFCLSSLLPKVRDFEWHRIRQAFDRLYERGVRHFKFIDRSFNLDLEKGIAILDYFLEKKDPSLFLHFEMIPDRLPPQLMERLKRFGPGQVQLEIGIQTLNPEVAKRIHRRQNLQKAEQNIVFLRRETQVHLHVDLIAGLPGETLESFAKGLNTLLFWNPHEIQLGILKKLWGAPIRRHQQAFDMVYRAFPPYEILKTRDMDFQTLQKLKRLARYWDLVVNSGRFPKIAQMLLYHTHGGSHPFARFAHLSQWLYEKFQRTYKISHAKLAHALYEYLEGFSDFEKKPLIKAMIEDFWHDGRSRDVPEFLKPYLDPSEMRALKREIGAQKPPRQARHHAEAGRFRGPTF